MKRLAALYGGAAPHHRSLHEPKYRQYFDEIVYLLDLPNTDLRRFDGLLIPERMHQGRLAAAQLQIHAFLNAGGTVIAFGEQRHAWLPGVSWQPRPTNYWWWQETDAHSGIRLARPEHSLFRHLAQSDVTWHQHGVFLAPAGADVLVEMEDGSAVLYIDRVSSPGTLLITSLDPIYHFGSYFMAATERFLDSFLPWVHSDLL